MIDSQTIQDLEEYARLIKPTDKLPTDNIVPVILGLFGEVGGIMAAAKKHRRENDAFVGYRLAVEEEFGDALWYFIILCSRLNTDPEEIFSDILRQLAIKFPDEQKSSIACIGTMQELESALLQLGNATSDILSLAGYSNEQKKLINFANCYMEALRVAGVTLKQIIDQNVKKVCGRFLKPDIALLPTFDKHLTLDEQLPTNFEIKITQRKSGRTYLQWNGVFIGDPLTDNIKDKDGYRFHDVLHLGHAAILHWSPTFRALIKHKRKSCAKTDEEQDSGRAIVVEEGLTAYIFSRAKELNLFKDQKNVSFDLLKTVAQFVAGYEVEKCPLSLWEDAILQGYEVFREVTIHNGGIVIGNRDKRTLRFVSL